MRKRWLPNVTKPGGNLNRLKINILYKYTQLCWQNKSASSKNSLLILRVNLAGRTASGLLDRWYVVCSGCDGCCVFCLYFEAWSCRCSCMGSVSVSQMLYVCVHPGAVLNAAFCMTCSLLMLVKDARGDHMEEAYSRAGLITALKIAISITFCLTHHVAVSAFMICRGLCACTEMLWV